MKTFSFKKHIINPDKVYAVREPFEIANGVAFLVEFKKDNGGFVTEFILYKNRERAVKGYYAFIRRMKKAGYCNVFSPNATLRDVMP